MKRIIAVLILAIFALPSVAQHKKVNFTKEFIKQNRGKFHIEVNELKELLITMLAITNSGLENDDMFEQKGECIIKTS
ncbi:hypothetical protein [Pedobacter sp. SL55]|uniref:hypothetical protein n=1 Tax=Pedobacter sp. SL55 TaxID=2995161 RepID=UPI00226EE5D3|nr:hypothetical protein [Pedobacter sp. SL55]WAC41872.1 hypothetical protein OVA16_05795 [Pedobacter sp. SL55]